MILWFSLPFGLLYGYFLLFDVHFYSDTDNCIEIWCFLYKKNSPAFGLNLLHRKHLTIDKFCECRCWKNGSVFTHKNTRFSIHLFSCDHRIHGCRLCREIFSLFEIEKNHLPWQLFIEKYKTPQKNKKHKTHVVNILYYNLTENSMFSFYKTVNCFTFKRNSSYLCVIFERLFWSTIEPFSLSLSDVEWKKGTSYYIRSTQINKVDWKKITVSIHRDKMW